MWLFGLIYKVIHSLLVTIQHFDPREPLVAIIFGKLGITTLKVK